MNAYILETMESRVTKFGDNIRIHYSVLKFVLEFLFFICPNRLNSWSYQVETWLIHKILCLIWTILAFRSVLNKTVIELDKNSNAK